MLGVLLSSRSGPSPPHHLIAFKLDLARPPAFPLKPLRHGQRIDLACVSGSSR
jgi:hypothetical protein